MYEQPTPEQDPINALYKRLISIARRPGALWLETARCPTSESRTIISAEPAVWIRGSGNFLDLIPGPAGDRGWLQRLTDADPGPGDAFERLQRIARRLRLSSPEGPTVQATTAPTFRGGLAGCFSYDLGRRFEELPALLDPDLPWDFLLGIYDEVLVISKQSNSFTHHRLPGAPHRLLEHWQRAREEVLWQPSQRTGISGELTPELDRESHARAVETIREHIRAGTIYQANLTLRFRGNCPDAETPLAVFLRLLRDNPAPYAAYLDLPETTLVSTSPENFLELHPHGQVRSKPIKGTIARVPGDPQDDWKARDSLVRSDKDRAELAMIVDLVRNDMGRVCSPGSVDRNSVLKPEAHPSVWHLVGDVRGNLAQGRDAFDLLRACFPPGSCIGAPKVRAMAILEELERSRRGPYTGAIGWIGLDSSMCLSVAIRTMVFRKGQVSYGVGGGIVYDSEAEAEWREALLKGEALEAALRPKAWSTDIPTCAGPHAGAAERRP